MKSSIVLCALFASGCVFDYEALRAGSGDGGTLIDSGVLDPAEALRYPDIVPACAAGWTSNYYDPFDRIDSSRWTFSGAPWEILGGVLSVDMGTGDDYWNRSFRYTQPVPTSMWMRVDFSVSSDDVYPQVSARVDPSAFSQRFYSVRVRGDRSGLQLVRQTAAENATTPEAEEFFLTPLLINTKYRLVIWTGRTDFSAPQLLLRAGIYDIAAGTPVFHTGSRVEFEYRGAQVYESGSIALSAWEHVARFDDLAIFGCVN